MNNDFIMVKIYPQKFLLPYMVSVIIYQNADF